MAPENPRDHQRSNMDSPSAQNGANTSNGASEPQPPSSTSVTNQLTQALRDLARGESTASALEAHLTDLETKLDHILASMGVEAGDFDDDPEEEGKKKDEDEDEGKSDKQGVVAKNGDEKTRGREVTTTDEDKERKTEG